MDVPVDPPQHPSTSLQNVSKSAWGGYLRNLGVWIGKRALTNSRGKVLIDLPSRVIVERFQTAEEEQFISWRTLVRTADNIDEGGDEWSRAELADFGALAADGSFSVGAQVFVGEAITIDQCIVENNLRIRSTHAFDWEGCLSGVVADRERFVAESLQSDEALDISIQRGVIEPVAWRNPRVLFDYMLGVWEGRGICIDARTSHMYKLTSRLRFSQGANKLVTTSSVLRVGEGGPTRVFEASGKLETNFILFAEANVQMLLLPGGVFVSSPIRIRQGRPFAIETAFLMKPDCCKRVMRLYNRDSEWINTVFLNERRTG